MTPRKGFISSGVIDMRKGSIMTIAILVFAIIASIGGYMIWYSFNNMRNFSRLYIREHDIRYSKLISRSLIQKVISETDAYSFSSCNSYFEEVKDDFVSYLEKNKVVGYRWADVASSSTCIGGTVITFDGTPWNQWIVDLVKLSYESSKVFYVARARRENENFDMFSWVFGKEVSSPPGPGATEVHSHSLFSGEDVSLPVRWVGEMDLTGPVSVNDTLYIPKSKKVHFKDEVNAKSIVSSNRWGYVKEVFFDKDVHAESVLIQKSNKVEFRSNLFVKNLNIGGNIRHGHWINDFTVSGTLCVENATIARVDEVDINNLNAGTLNIIRVNDVRIQGDLKAENVLMSDIWNSVEIMGDFVACNYATMLNNIKSLKGNNVYAKSLYINSRGRGIDIDLEDGNIISDSAIIENNVKLKANSVHSNSLYIHDVDLNLEDILSGIATIIDTENDVSLENFLTNYLYLDNSYNDFKCIHFA